MAVVTKAQANDPSRKPSKAEAHPLYKVTRSKVHGFGAFATRDIKKGETIDEYLGDRISHAQADKRYEDHDENDNHTFLFIVDKKTVIDAGVGGNDARFINHKCDPNCESEIKKRPRVHRRHQDDRQGRGDSATTTRSAARRTIRRTSTRSTPAAAARRSAAARCCGRRSGPSPKKRKKKTKKSARGKSAKNAAPARG